MPAQRVFIIHGYQSHPDEAWLPWLKSELQARGYAVTLPAMPDPTHPVIDRWIEFIAAQVGAPDEQTILVGHSIGGQAILRYLGWSATSAARLASDRFPAPNNPAPSSFAGTVLVASTFPLARTPEESDRETGGDPILRPWFSQGVDAAAVKAAAGRCTVILSDNDPYIDWDRASADFRAALDPEIIVEAGCGHFNEDDHLEKLPVALAAVLKIQ